MAKRLSTWPGGPLRGEACHFATLGETPNGAETTGFFLRPLGPRRQPRQRGLVPDLRMLRHNLGSAQHQGVCLHESTQHGPGSQTSADGVPSPDDRREPQAGQPATAQTLEVLPLNPEPPAPPAGPGAPLTARVGSVVFLVTQATARTQGDLWGRFVEFARELWDQLLCKSDVNSDATG